MFKKLLIIFLLFFACNCVVASDWIELVNPKGKKISLDKKSIQEKSHYYFFNIKMNVNNVDELVVTMQCAKTHAFCARINKYKLSHYEELNGDYKNIFLNETSKLEPITFQSRAYMAYKKVREIMSHKNKPEIAF